MQITRNIRGLNFPKNYKAEFVGTEKEKELHDCFDCKGCICEDVCKEYEEKEFGLKEGGKN